MSGYRDRRSCLGIPYMVFLVLFVALPVVILGCYAFTNGQGQFSLENFYGFFRDSRTLGTLFYSFIIALLTTAVCLLLAYPAALILAKGNLPRGGVLLTLFVLPMWINFTLRLTALREILTVLEGNLAYYPLVNTVVSMTYDFLPFMILPIYNTIARIDVCYLEAARDLGARPVDVLCKILIPLSMPGITSGITMVLLPAMTNYVVLDMMYNSTYIMGSLIGSYFAAYDWNNGSLISLILLALALAISALAGEFADESGSKTGGVMLG